MEQQQNSEYDGDDRRGSLEFSAPGGWRARLSGIDTKIVLLAILVALVAGGLTYQWYLDKQIDRESRDLYVGNHKITQTMLSTVITNQAAIIAVVKESRLGSKDDINEILYLLSLDQKKREALHIEMPSSLRQKLRSQ